MSPPPALLRVIVEHRVVSEVPVVGVLTIGRRSDNAVVLADEAVSGHHGRIEPHGAGFRYVDLGSMNGSLVSAGSRLRKGESVSLDDVTQIRIGRTVLEFRLALEPETTDEAAPAADAADAPRPLVESTSGALLGPGLWGAHDIGAGLIHTPAVIPPGLDAQPAETESSGEPAPGRPRPSRFGSSTALTPARGARLIVLLGDAGTEAPVRTLAPQESLLLGRRSSADLVVKDPSVSDPHARFEVVDKHWTLVDVGSTNGTRLGRARVSKPTPLPDMAHVTVGAVELFFLHDPINPKTTALRAPILASWLRKRGLLTRRQARAALREQRASGCALEEVLVRRRVLQPGAMIEAAHDFFVSGGLSLGAARRPMWEWALVAVLVAVVALVAWGLFG